MRPRVKRDPAHLGVSPLPPERVGERRRGEDRVFGELVPDHLEEDRRESSKAVRNRRVQHESLRARMSAPLFIAIAACTHLSMVTALSECSNVVLAFLSQLHRGRVSPNWVL